MQLGILALVDLARIFLRVAGVISFNDLHCHSSWVAVAKNPRVIVVGAGPSGMAAAAAVAEHGLACQVLEAQQTGKDKPCGDAFVASAVAELRRLGLTEHDFSGFGRRFESIDLRVAGESMLRLAEPQDAGWILPRRLIDQMLRDQIAVKVPIAYGSRVERLTPRDNEIEVIIASGTSLRSELVSGVVIANGARSRLANRLGLDGDPVPAISVSTYASLTIEQPWFDFDDSAPMGYSWGFPVSETTANIGICRLATGTRRDLQRGVDHLERLLPPRSVTAWRGGFGPTWSGRFARRHDVRGVVTCGDAAGTVDPLTGEGLTMALRTGHAAGHAIANFLLGDHEALDRYTVEVSDTLSRNYRTVAARALWPLLTQAPGFGTPWRSPV
jgi:flavin-dependent dehydrogenase